MKYVIKTLKYMGLFSMTVILGVFLLSSNVLRSIPNQVMEQTRIHATIYDYVSNDERIDVQQEIEKLNKVKSVTYSTKEQELEYLLELYNDDGTLRNLYTENNPLQNTFIIEVNNFDYVEDVINTLNDFGEIDQVNSNYEDIKAVVGRSDIVMNVLNAICVISVVVFLIRLRHFKAVFKLEKMHYKQLLLNGVIGLVIAGLVISGLASSYNNVFALVETELNKVGLILIPLSEQLPTLIPILLFFTTIWSITGKCEEINKEDFE